MKKNLHIIILAFVFSLVLWFSISLSNEYYATFDIPVRLVDFPEGYTTGTAIPKTISVKLKGRGWGGYLGFFMVRMDMQTMTAVNFTEKNYSHSIRILST